MIKEQNPRKLRRPPPGEVVWLLMTLVGSAIAEEAPSTFDDPDTLDGYQRPSTEKICSSERMGLLNRTETSNSTVKVNGSHQGEYVAENEVGWKKKIER